MKKYIVPLAVAAALAFPASARAETGTVEVVADCVGGLTVITSGFSDGEGWLVIGGEPQRTFTLNTTVVTAWPLSLAGLYDYTVIAIPGNGEAIQGHLDCAPAVEPEPVVVEPDPVVEVETATLDLSAWNHVALAPPW
jgi:hypothetical protein